MQQSASACSFLSVVENSEHPTFHSRGANNGKTKPSVFLRDSGQPGTAVRSGLADGRRAATRTAEAVVIQLDRG
jgi:hypothetical protein